MEENKDKSSLSFSPERVSFDGQTGTEKEKIPANEADSPKEKSPYSYGGQALIEGVMMRGRTSMAIAVREPSGNVATECKRIADVRKSIWYRIPVVRGVFNFGATLVMGFKTLMRSAEAAGEEDEQLGKGGMAFAVIIALALFVGLFIFVPRLAASGLERWLFEGHRYAFLFTNITESVLRIIIFILYLWGVSLMKDIRRTYMYHGAEHKTINAYEKGAELTVENVKKHSTRHNRCGTTFLFFVIVISIFVFTLVTWGCAELGLRYDATGADGLSNRFLYNVILMAIRIALLPFVAGLSYELLRLLARGKDSNIVLRILRAPGLGLQRLTTKEPTDDMLEVAIASFHAAYAMDHDPDMQDYKFQLTYDFKRFYDAKKEALAAAGVSDGAALDWVCCDILNVSRGGLNGLKLISRGDGDKIAAACDKLKAGQPLQYVQGFTEFMGNKFTVDKSVLIPRPETELLAEAAVKYAVSLKAQGGEIHALDLCCGSGCIGITLALKAGISVTLSDVSADAAATAGKNADSLGAQNITVVNCDMLTGLSGGYDIITFNPPYIRTADIETLERTVKDHEPVLALDGGADGLDFYRRLHGALTQPPKDGTPYLRAGGRVFMEIGKGQAQDIRDIFKGFNVETIQDYNGIERILVLFKE